MLALFSILEVLSAIALSLGVGSSTFALIFHFMGMRSPTARTAGKPYQHVVYIVLRVAMALVLLAEIGKVVLYIQNGLTVETLRTAHPLLFLWTLIGMLYANAILMTLHRMPMRLGPAIQATSWYALGVLTALPAVTFTYLPLLLTYLGGIVVMAVIIELITQRIVQKVAKKQRRSPMSSDTLPVC